MKLEDDKDGLWAHALARNSDPPTSHAAAASLSRDHLNALEAVVVHAVASKREHGCTFDEIEDILAPKGIPARSITPRLKPLRKKGWIVDTGLIRPGRSGRPQMVVRVTDEYLQAMQST